MWTDADEEETKRRNLQQETEVSKLVLWNLVEKTSRIEIIMDSSITGTATIREIR
ncbi:MAG: hypothetical protein ACI90V_011772 [Bacillariaceae sp.]|jgi:hypothetical protein